MIIKKVSASKLARLMECKGSVFFKDLPDREDSEAGKEGTAAAEVLERLLKDDAVPEYASNGVAITEEMVYYAKGAMGDIKDQTKGEVNSEVYCAWNNKADIQVRGKYDASYTGDNGHLFVDDYKYGYGLVEVEKNWQLLCYAIGEIIRQGKSYELITMRILQPRAHHEDGNIRSWTISYNELLGYKSQIEDVLCQVATGENELQTTSQCKYCDAASVCPAMNKAYHRGVEVVQDFIQDYMDENELAYQLDLVKRISDLVKTRQDSLELLAKQRLREGKLIPNYAAKDSYGNRSWSSKVTPQFIETMTGLDITERKMLSPAKAERLGLDKDLVIKLTERKMIGQKLKKVDVKKIGANIFGTANPIEGE